MAGAYDADPLFQANPLQLEHLLQRIAVGSLAIPDFQRDFTWEPRRTVTLLRSLMSRFPAGTFLFWTVGSDNKVFGHRAFEGAPHQKGDPHELVLDGQQRLTSLYRAFNGIGEERFFLSVGEFVDLPSPKYPEGRLKDLEEIRWDDANVIFWHARESKEAAALDSREKRIMGHVLAVDEQKSFDEWLDDYAEWHEEEMAPKPIKKLLRQFKERYLTPLRSYGFPVVTLPSSTTIEAVATVFETINSTSKPLGVFELLTARFYPDGVHLRDLWDQALEDYPILEEFSVEAYSVLQAITLRACNSAQRSDVLRRLKAAHVKEFWEPVVRGYARVLEFLQSECGVATPKLLPYTMLLVPMAAVWDDIGKTKGPEWVNVRARLGQYFWCTVFATNYDQGANSQAGADYSKLKNWLLDDASDAPEAVSGFSLTASTLLSATTRRKAIYAGLMALTVTDGARDFHSDEKLTPDRVRAYKVDSHHIFPKAFLSAQSVSMGAKPNAELILNRALIDPITNKMIGSRAPSVYLQELKNVFGQDKLAEILESHLIAADSEVGPLFRDDYEGFLQERLNEVVAAIEGVTGRLVTRDDLPGL